MTANRVALRGRAAAERLMTDTCTVTRTTSEPALNQATGTITDPTTLTVYAGKCRLKPATRLDQPVQVGETMVAKWRWTVSVPFGTPVELNDVITVNASQDPVMVGKQIRVRSTDRGTHITAHRLHGEEIEDGSR